MADKYSTFEDVVSNPSTHLVAVVPSDTVDLTDAPKALFIGTGGDLVVIGVNAPTGAVGVKLTNVADGSILPVRARRVLATGTTATGIVALY